MIVTVATTNCHAVVFPLERDTACVGHAATSRTPRTGRPPCELTRKLLECRVRRLPLSRNRLQARLPAAQVRLVAEQEPEHELDARVLAGDRERLREIGRLLRPGDAEERVRRVRLPAVLRDPD